MTGERTSLMVDHGFGAELLRLRPRSAQEYAFSGDAPRYVHCILFIVLGVFALLSLVIADCLQLISADLWIDWAANLKVLGLVAFCILGGFVLSAAALSWIFHPWLQRHELVVCEHGLRGRFPDLDFSLPFDELIEVWICRHPDCRDDDACKARNSAHCLNGESAAALRRMESMITTYLTGLAWIFGLILALAGGAGPAPPKRHAIVKIFLVVKGGMAYSLGPYLRRFQQQDRGRLLEALSFRLREVLGSHEA